MFGNFSELPFLEVIRLLRKRQGRLVIRTERNESYKLFVQNGMLVKMLHENCSIENNFVQNLLELSRSNSGSFEFIDLAYPLEDHSMNLDLDGLDSWLIAQTPNLSKLDRELEELERLRDALPHPQTFFVVSEMRSLHAQATLSIFLERWRVSHPTVEGMLMQGMNAEQLAEITLLTLERAQLALYRLHLAEVVHVKRVKENLSMPIARSAEPNVRKPSLISRLLGALGLIGAKG